MARGPGVVVDGRTVVVDALDDFVPHSQITPCVFGP